MTNVGIGELSNGKLFRRGSTKRPAPSSGSSGSQKRNQRARFDQNLGQGRAASPIGSSARGQSSVDGSKATCGRDTTRSSGGNQAHKTTSTGKLSETERNQNSQSGGRSRSMSAGQSHIADTANSASGSDRSPGITQGTRSPSPSSGQNRGSSGHTRSPSSNSQSLGSSLPSRDSEGKRMSFSSEASSTRRRHPVSVSTMTLGPAIVEIWKGRTRGRVEGPAYVGQGETLSMTSTDPKRVEALVTHDSVMSETSAVAKGRKASMKYGGTLLQHHLPASTRRTMAEGFLSGPRTITAIAQNRGRNSPSPTRTEDILQAVYGQEFLQL